MLIVCRIVSKKHASTYWMQSTRSYTTPAKQKFLIQNCTFTNNNLRKSALAEEIIVTNALRSIIGSILQRVRDLHDNIDNVRLKTKSDISAIPELKQTLTKNGTFMDRNLRKTVLAKDIKSGNTPKSTGASILEISRANHNDSIQVKTKSESSANPKSKQVLEKVINTLSVGAPILIHHISHTLSSIWIRTKTEGSITPEKKQILDKDDTVKGKTVKEIVLPDVQVINTLSVVAPALIYHIGQTLSNIWLKTKSESSVTPEKTQILDKTCSSVDKNLETAKEINNTNTLTSAFGYILVPNLHHIVGSFWASTQWKSCVTPDLNDILITCSTLVDYNLLKGIAYILFTEGATYCGYPLNEQAQVIIVTIINYFISDLSADEILTNGLKVADPYLPSSVRALNIVEWIYYIRVTIDACNYVMTYCKQN